MIKKIILNYSNKFLSRWLILAIDLFFVFNSFIIAAFLRFNFEFSNHYLDHLGSQVLLAMVFYGIGFFFSNSYAGIIRHTSVNDAYRVLKACFFGVTLTFLFSFFFQKINPESALVIPKSIIIIHFLLCLFFLVTFRFGVKASFNFFLNKNSNRKRVVIFGAGSSGLITKGTLLQDKSMKYEVFCFIDDNEYKIGKSLDGVNVYPPKKLETNWLKQNRISEVIISVQKISPERKREIVDLCLDAGINVKTVPSIKKWINGELSVKQIKAVKIEDLLERPVIKLENKQIIGQIQDKVVLITGAAGSIGSEIVRQIIELKPSALLMLDVAETPLHNLELEIKQHENFPLVRTEFIIGNICNKERIETIFRHYKPDVVYHAAAYKHVPMMEENPYEAVFVNVFGTKVIADLSVENGVKKFVMVSTDKAVNPTNIMGTTKRIAEIYTQAISNSQKSTKFITTRFGNVLGSNGSVIPLFKRQIEEGGPITVTHKDITRFFMTIPEACQLVLEAGTMGLGGEIFVFDMGESVKIYDVALKMIKLSGLTFGKDIDIKITGLRPGEKLYEELLNDKENTMPTHHPKIMIGKVRTADYNTVLNQLNELYKTLSSKDNFNIVRKMKEIVPEFVSQNSIYSSLDVDQTIDKVNNN